MDRKEIKRQLEELRTKTDPRFRAALTAVANGLEQLLDGAAKGGRVRAKKLSKKRRSEIARTAAKARWANEKSK
jgi:hypothetical protein